MNKSEALEAGKKLQEKARVFMIDPQVFVHGWAEVYGKEESPEGNWNYGVKSGDLYLYAHQWHDEWHDGVRYTCNIGGEDQHESLHRIYGNNKPIYRETTVDTFDPQAVVKTRLADARQKLQWFTDVAWKRLNDAEEQINE